MTDPMKRTMKTGVLEGKSDDQTSMAERPENHLAADTVTAGKDRHLQTTGPRKGQRTRNHH
jgi:hypothetical protein